MPQVPDFATAGSTASRTTSSRCRSSSSFRPRARSTTSRSTSPSPFDQDVFVEKIEMRPSEQGGRAPRASAVVQTLRDDIKIIDGRAYQPRREARCAEERGASGGLGFEPSPDEADLLRARTRLRGASAGHREAHRRRKNSTSSSTCTISRAASPKPTVADRALVQQGAGDARSHHRNGRSEGAVACDLVEGE